MKKIYLLLTAIFSVYLCHAQNAELVFGNTTDLSVVNFSPPINVVQHGSGTTVHNFDLDADGTNDLSLTINRKLSALYEAAYINFPNPAAQVALNAADNLTVIAFKSGDSLVASNYSFDFNENAFDGAILYVSQGNNHYGQFEVPTLRYLGFRIAGADTLYGWLKLARTSEFNTDSLAYRVEQLAYQGTLTDILPIAQAENLNIYPTVTSDVVYIENNDATQATASVYNLTGNLLFRSKIATTKNEIHLKGYPSGIYFLKISSSKGDRTFKLIKE